MTFGQKIKKLRADNNLTQERLAEMLFVTRTAVSKWETDKGLPGIDTIKLISTTFSISLDELISDDIAESTKIIDNQRARLMYVFAMGFLMLIIAFTLTAYFTANRYFGIGSCVALTGYVIFALLSRPKYKRVEASKHMVPFIISRVIISLIVIGIIVYTLVTL